MLFKAVLYDLCGLILSMTDRTVEARLVPVSLSATGKTLNLIKN